MTVTSLFTDNTGNIPFLTSMPHFIASLHCASQIFHCLTSWRFALHEPSLLMPFANRSAHLFFLCHILVISCNISNIVLLFTMVIVSVIFVLFLQKDYDWQKLKWSLALFSNKPLLIKGLYIFIVNGVTKVGHNWVTKTFTFTFIFLDIMLLLHLIDYSMV